MSQKLTPLRIRDGDDGGYIMYFIIYIKNNIYYFYD